MPERHPVRDRSEGLHWAMTVKLRFQQHPNEVMIRYAPRSNVVEQEAVELALQQADYTDVDVVASQVDIAQLVAVLPSVV